MGVSTNASYQYSKSLVLTSLCPRPLQQSSGAFLACLPPARTGNVGEAEEEDELDRLFHEETVEYAEELVLACQCLNPGEQNEMLCAKTAKLHF